MRPANTGSAQIKRRVQCSTVNGRASGSGSAPTRQTFKSSSRVESRAGRRGSTSERMKMKNMVVGKKDDGADGPIGPAMPAHCPAANGVRVVVWETVAQ